MRLNHRSDNAERILAANEGDAHLHRPPDRPKNADRDDDHDPNRIELPEDVLVPGWNAAAHAPGPTEHTDTAVIDVAGLDSG